LSNHVVIQEIKKTLDVIGKELQLHEGGIQFIDFKDGVLYLSFLGSCVACPAFACGSVSNFEQKFIDAVPAIRKVVVI